MNLGEVITTLQQSGVDLTRETNVGEIKFKGAEFIAVQFLGLAIPGKSGVTSDDIDDAVSQIESAISDLESAKRSLR